MNALELKQFQDLVIAWAEELGFDQIGFSDIDLSAYEASYQSWLAQRFYGDMGYMQRNVEKRLDPSQLIPDTVCVISVRMNYLTEDSPKILNDPDRGNISRYALGRDYHKTVRQRLRRLSQRIEAHTGNEYRAFVDSAPVLEKPLAEKAGLGWVGKHTLILNEEAGSFFFLGELFTDIPFKTNEQPQTDRCGACKACINICPTKAITGPRQLDARRCISYLTIEHKGSIPVEYRKAIGNRIFGCDDCQLICPWNRFAQISIESDFTPRHGLDNPRLIDLLMWDEATFLARTEGMAIRRINFSQWLRNLAVAAGNATSSPELIQAVSRQRDLSLERQDNLAREHLDWALTQLTHPKSIAENAHDKT